MNQTAFPQYVVKAYLDAHPISTEPQKFLPPYINNEDKNEKEVFDGIVKSLKLYIKNNQAIKDKLKNKPKSNELSYAIIFRQSESWKDIEDLFAGITMGAIDDDLSRNADMWIKLIKELKMRVLYRKCAIISKVYHENQIATLRNTNFRPEFYPLVESNIQVHSNVISLVAERLERLNNQIQTLVDAIQELYNQNMNNEKLLENTDFKQTLKILKNKWPHLFLFQEWSEVDLDEKRLYARVEIVEDKDKGLLEKKVDELTKGIILVKDGNKLEVENCFFAQPSPRDSYENENKPSRFLEESDFLGIDLDRKKKISSRNKFTSLAPQIDRIGKCAIIEINKEFFPDEESKYIIDFLEN